MTRAAYLWVPMAEAPEGCYPMAWTWDGPATRDHDPHDLDAVVEVVLRQWDGVPPEHRVLFPRHVGFFELASNYDLSSPAKTFGGAGHPGFKAMWPQLIARLAKADAMPARVVLDEEYPLTSYHLWPALNRAHGKEGAAVWWRWALDDPRVVQSLPAEFKSLDDWRGDGKHRTNAAMAALTAEHLRSLITDPLRDAGFTGAISNYGDTWSPKNTRDGTPTPAVRMGDAASPVWYARGRNTPEAIELHAMREVMLSPALDRDAPWVSANFDGAAVIDRIKPLGYRDVLVWWNHSLPLPEGQTGLLERWLG